MLEGSGNLCKLRSRFDKRNLIYDGLSQTQLGENFEETYVPSSPCALCPFDFSYLDLSYFFVSIFYSGEGCSCCKEIQEVQEGDFSAPSGSYLS